MSEKVFDLRNKTKFGNIHPNFFIVKIFIVSIIYYFR